MLEKVRPDVVHVTASSFGIHGPYAPLRGSSLVDWAAGGSLFTPQAKGAVMRAQPAINVSGFAGGSSPGYGMPTPAYPQLPGVQAPTKQIGLVNIVRPGVAPAYQPGNQTQSGPGTALVRSCGTCAPNDAKVMGGYHWNKSGFYRKGGPCSKYAPGWVEKGTVCVKNRRRNPLNPRALSRSMSRIHSAKKAAHFLNRIHIGPARRKKA